MVIVHFAKREFESILYATAQVVLPTWSSLTAFPIQRSSVFARDHASEEHIQEVSSPLARMARRLMPVQLSPLSYSLRYLPPTLFTPLMNSSVRRAFPSISNIRSDICCEFAVHQKDFPI